jgi:hypothetical protein
VRDAQESAARIEDKAADGSGGLIKEDERQKIED